MEFRSAAAGSRGLIAPTLCEPSTSFCSSYLPLRRQNSRPLAPPRDTPRHVCKATDPGLMQDVLMGGAVVGAVGAALANGLKGEPEVCASCAGSGGVRCFACEGTGKMSGVTLEELAKATAAQRDPMGRSVSKRECRACRGCGLLFCKKCSGSGYCNK
jgi:hypothetical protein